MRSEKFFTPWKKRYRTLLTRLRPPGLLLVGTITRRMDRRPDPHAPGHLKTYGPYYQWTFKDRGKTKTVNLTARQARLFGQAIRNHRAVEKTLLEMRRLSLKILQATTEGVPTRTRRK
jgi:hypothetical protein